MDFQHIIESVGSFMDFAGVAVMVLGALISIPLALRGYQPERLPAGSAPLTLYRSYRQLLGRSILLGLELLVAADIIRSVAVTPTFEGVGVLGIIVLIRTFLSFSLELEITGRWPWQTERGSDRKGLTTEFSGTQLALIELMHWYELVLLLGLIVLFFIKPLWVGILIALFAFVLELVIDNICARTSWKWMLKMTWLIGLGAAMTNISWLYLAKG
jgi:uncharacterized membrane protein